MVDRGILNGWNDRVLILDETWEPGCWDVICQGGRDSYEHIGNRRFRVCIDNNLNTYSAAKTKHEKSLVVTVIVDAVRDSSTQGRGGFVRKDPKSGRWYQVGDKIAREKVGHALRDAMKLRQKLESKQGHSPPERPKAAKRRRTEGKDFQKLQKSAEVSSAEGPSSFYCGAKSWKKSLSASAEQFLASIQSNDSSQCGGGDIVLNELALATSSGSEDEAAYQRSLDELQKAGEEDTFSFDTVSLGVRDPATADRKPLSQQESAPVSKRDDSLDEFMKRFLGGTTQTNRTLGSATKDVAWKPPSDSATEAAFETCMTSLNPKPSLIHSMKRPACPSSMNEKPHVAKKPSIGPLAKRGPFLIGINASELPSEDGLQKPSNNFGQLPSLVLD